MRWRAEGTRFKISCDYSRKGGNRIWILPIKHQRTLFLKHNHEWCSQQRGLSVSLPLCCDRVCSAVFPVSAQWKQPWRKPLGCPGWPPVHTPHRVGLWAGHLRTRVEIILEEESESCGCCIHSCTAAADLHDTLQGDGVKRSSAGSSVSGPSGANGQDFAPRKRCWWRGRARWQGSSGVAQGVLGCAAWLVMNLRTMRKRK